MINKKQNLTDLIAKIMHRDNGEKTDWKDVPKDLRDQTLFFLATGIGFFGLNSFFLVKSIRGKSLTFFYTTVIGVLIGCGLLVYGLYLYTKFRYKNYKVITGICTEIANANFLYKKSILIYFKDSQGISYQVALDSKKNTFIRQGDKINIYMPDDLSYYEKDGIYIIARFYSIKKEAISKQLESMSK